MISNIINPDVLIFPMDMMGITAAAISGTLLARHKGLDVSGCIFVSMISAVGGGTIRDLILDRNPMFWLVDFNYIVVVTTTSLVIQAFFHLNHKIDSLVKIFDSIGLSVFSIIGIKVALMQGAAPLMAVMMGACTAALGGLMRDIVCNELPMVFQREIYIAASIAGGCLYFLLGFIGVDKALTELVVLIFIFAARMCAIKFDWRAPIIRLTA